jgi:hypothetical protein
MLILLLVSLFGVESPPVQSATPAKQSANDPDKVICRRFAVTGSLVSSYKTCKTRREWDSEHAALRATGPASDSCRNSGNGGPC